MSGVVEVGNRGQLKVIERDNLLHGSPDSTHFGAKGNRTIAKTELIEGWFITKTVKWGKSNFKVQFLNFSFKIFVYCIL